MRIFYRFNSQFKIDDSKLPAKARTTTIKDALYTAVYVEFFGASENIKYKHLTTIERMNALNDFASKWLTDRGFK